MQEQNLSLQDQNRNLLLSVDNTTKSQAILQRTVEGLSVIVIAYYLSGLANYLFKAFYKLGWLTNYDLVSGLFVPIALGISCGLIVWGRQRLHRKHFPLNPPEKTSPTTKA